MATGSVIPVYYQLSRELIYSPRFAKDGELLSAAIVILLYKLGSAIYLGILSSVSDRYVTLVTAVFIIMCIIIIKV